MAEFCQSYCPGVGAFKWFVEEESITQPLGQTWETWFVGGLEGFYELGEVGLLGAVKLG